MRVYDPDPDDVDHDPHYIDAPDMTDIGVTVTDNPVLGELLGPDGAVIRQVRERPPIGFR